MSIPLDRLYHYIESVASEVRKDDVLIYRFWPHGSKNINDLDGIKDHTRDKNTFCPQIICHDQEPLNYNMYKDVPVRLGKKFMYTGDSNALPKQNLRVFTGNIYDHCLLLHSEKSSAEIQRYQQDRFVPVYFWSHAVIAKDWFRYAPYVNFVKDIKKTFLIYNRAWSGTREYRLKFSDLLIENNLLKYCKTNFNPVDDDHYYKTYSFTNNQWRPGHNLEMYLDPTSATSVSSADFDINDYNNTEFEVVLETLFDDQRHHLTEKTLRPIACKQPFILASTPGSLNYLRSYGFQTFGEIFDESYDFIVNPVERLQQIIKTMREIASWSPEYKSIQMKKINAITEYNHRHFFSDEFFNTVIAELKNNLTWAFDYIENNNIGQVYRDLTIKHIPGMKQWRNTHEVKSVRIDALKKIKEHRKRNCTWIK
jgi:hypothetical protein